MRGPLVSTPSTPGQPNKPVSAFSDSCDSSPKKEKAMDTSATVLQRMEEDKVSAILKWVLLGIAVVTFALLAWATEITYRTAPPRPEQLLAPDGTVAMTSQDIEDGKASFQRADLMDYGSIYGMGSYFGEDYTAEYLARLGQVTQDNLAQARFAKPFASLGEEDQRAIQAAMQRQLKGIDLSGHEVQLSAAVAGAIKTLQGGNRPAVDASRFHQRLDPGLQPRR
jgi:nitric oxide reductase subunit B